MVKLFSKSLQGIKGGGAPFCAALRAALCAMRSRKRPCQPKTAKRRSDFLAAPVHMAPPGRQKSERAFCLFGGVFLRPACRAVCRGGRSCAACRCCGGFCARCPVFFLPVCRCLVPGLRLSAVFCLACAACLPFGRRRLCFRLAGSLPLLCLARAAGACLPFARRALCVHGFSLLFFLFPASLLPLKNLFIAQAATGLYFLPKRK